MPGARQCGLWRDKSQENILSHGLFEKKNLVQSAHFNALGQAILSIVGFGAGLLALMPASVSLSQIIIWCF